jgi:DNA-binding NarL/FixJ family response regulator
MRVAVADDSALFRDGLALLLSTAGFDVVHQAASGAELVTLLATDPVDVAVLDIRMPPTFTDEGLSTARQLRQTRPELGLLILSTYAETQYAVQVLDIGERGVGYLLKDRVSDTPTLLDALERIASGESVIDPDIVHRLLARQRVSTVLQQLRPRESEVLSLIAQGRSNQAIARELSLNIKTVEHYIATLFIHLGLEDSTEDNRRVLATLRWLRSDAATSARQDAG